MRTGSWNFLLMISIVFCACGNNESKQEAVAHAKINTENKPVGNEAERARGWLTKSIEYNFGHENAENMAKIFTKTYYEYKLDAINVDYDGMSLEEFEQKWKDRFNTKYAGIGTGFIISGQDYGKIKVSSCKCISNTPDSVYVFKSTISDSQFKIDYVRDIKLVPSGDTFLVADILEYN